VTVRGESVESGALPDAEERRRIVEDLDTTFFVEAAAGTGKTTALVGRIVALLASGRASLGEVVALTFTDKAAGEMRLRLRADLERARQAASASGEAHPHLDAALEELELAKIATIHAFCGDLLQEHPVEAGVDPLFAVASPDESARLLERAFDDWFQRVLSDPPEGVRRFLRRRPRGRDARGARETLLGAVRTLVEHRDFTASWRRDAFGREAAIDAMMSRLEALAALAKEAAVPDDWLSKNLTNVANWVDENRRREEVRDRDYDALEADLRDLWRPSRKLGWHWKGRNRREFAPGVLRADVVAQRDEAVECLRRLGEDCDADLAACLQPELQPVVERYAEHKRTAGVLDFVDLLIRARDLLVSDTAVREALTRRHTHFFVDEFQDTDPLQAEILLLLASEDPKQRDWRKAVPGAGRLFVVGDPKQSIYRFRRADVAVYEQTKARLREHGACVLMLRASFRATPTIQHAVNAAFAPVMQGAEDGSQAQYVALEAVRAEVPSQPAVVVVPAPQPYGDYGNVVNWMIDASLPDAVGAFVAWLVDESGWTVEEGGERVPVSARHVCLLFRRFKSFRDDVTRPYVRALEARRVPHVLVGGRSFHDREEVIALRNALVAIEWPGDDLSVYATLRGPLFALSDDVLLAWRAEVGTLHPLAPRPGQPPAEVLEVGDALDVLARLHRGRNRRPIADTVSRLLDAVRAHAALAIWPTGEQALANCLRVVDLARRFERGGAPSFRAFVDRLEDEAARGEAEDAPVVEEGTEGVRIMTTHRAKGLEFPVVVLCDPTCNASRETPSRHVDPERSLWAEPLAGCAPRELLEAREVELARDRAEAVRLAYVAATRARDLLVLPGVADHELGDVWLGALHPVMHPSTRSSGEGEPAPGCPPFEGAAVGPRPASARPGNRTPVRAGALTPREGRHRVVWWDPKILPLDVQERVGLRQQRILEADEDGSVAAEGERLHGGWRASREATLAAGATPTWSLVPVTALAEERAAAGARVEVRVEIASRERTGRPSGKRFGSLVHGMLAEVDLRADTGEIARVATLQGRLLDASIEEVEAACSAVAEALAHPILVRAAASDKLRRETPLWLRGDDGRLAEGIVDLAFHEPGEGWTVVDFKTDVELGERRDAYAHQVRLYAEAIAHATGEPAEPLLLVV
jgi:ATP-dependent exoDNAse (exonuclease V) beta subunit